MGVANTQTTRGLTTHKRPHESEWAAAGESAQQGEWACKRTATGEAARSSTEKEAQAARKQPTQETRARQQGRPDLGDVAGLGVAALEGLGKVGPAVEVKVLDEHLFASTGIQVRRRAEGC